MFYQNFHSLKPSRNLLVWKGTYSNLVLTTKSENICNTDVIQPELSDHFLVEFELKGNWPKVKENGHYVKLYSKADSKHIRHKIAKTRLELENLSSLNSPIDTMYGCFVETLQSCIAGHVPTKWIKSCDPHQPPWLDSEAWRAVSNQRELYNLYKKSKN